MPMMVHLTSAKNVKQIARTGIRKGERGVYCMPVLPDYYTSHQWLRELKRWGPGPFVAIYFRLHDDELVGCGPFWEAHRCVPVAEAVRLFRQQSETQGWEILVPRSIASRELHKVQALSQVLGWRYHPNAHARPWCNCPACVSRGEFNASKKREQRSALTYDEILAKLRRLHAEMEECQDPEANDDEIMQLLYLLQSRKAGQASDFLFLVEYSSNDVLEALADLLGVYKGKEAKRLLQEVNARRRGDQVNIREVVYGDD
jgi:hypothetical protein